MSGSSSTSRIRALTAAPPPGECTRRGGRAAARLGVDLDLPPSALHRLAHDREAEPEAVPCRARRCRSGRRSAAALGRDPRARVAHLDDDTSRRRRAPRAATVPCGVCLSAFPGRFAMTCSARSRCGERDQSPGSRPRPRHRAADRSRPRPLRAAAAARPAQPHRLLPRLSACEHEQRAGQAARRLAWRSISSTNASRRPASPSRPV